MSIWTSVRDLQSKVQNKKVYFWGASAHVKSTIEKTGIVPDGIYDNNPAFQGVLMDGVLVSSFDKAQFSPNDSVIVITTGSYQSLVEQLAKFDSIKAGENLFMTPVLNRMRLKERLFNVDVDLLITVPLPPNEGGGLYEFNTKKGTLTHHYSGESRALVKYDEGYLMCDGLSGLVCLDSQLRVENTIDLPKGSRPHGLAYSLSRKIACVVSAGRDSICFVDVLKSHVVDEVFISEKCKQNGMNEQHHLNDIVFSEDEQELYVSMFSFSGHWRQEIFDGGVMSFDMKSLTFSNEKLFSNLWMPHTTSFVDNKLFIIDSMRGIPYLGSTRPLAKLPGFIRGMDYDDEFLYIGQSAHRYTDKLERFSENIQLNCGIYVLDVESKSNYFFNFDEFDNIYSILVKK